MYDIKICKVTFVNLRVVSKLSTMVDRLVRNVPSQRGKVNLEDSNQFRYCNNGEGKFTTRWRCSKRSCPATLTTRNSTGNLTDPTLPDHNHANKLMKMVARRWLCRIFLLNRMRILGGHSYRTQQVKIVLTTLVRNINLLTKEQEYSSSWTVMMQCLKMISLLYWHTLSDEYSVVELVH